MSTPLRSQEEAAPAAPADPPPVYLDARAQFAAHFLSGEGLEIGPLHQPLAMPPHAYARYVDRMSADELREEYPELAGWNLTQVDVIDDGEKLTTVAEASQDFIVANHFLEHCENPIGTIETHLGKLKPGGVLFYAVPDKRFTFDFRRSPTPIEHMVADYEEGPERSRREHYEEWAQFVTGGKRSAQELESERYSIHMHVWTQAEFLQLILACRARLGDAFDIEAAARQGIEFVVVLRKRGPTPAPAPPVTASQPGLPARVRSKLGRGVRAALRRSRR